MFSNIVLAFQRDVRALGLLDEIIFGVHSLCSIPEHENSSLVVYRIPEIWKITLIQECKCIWCKNQLFIDVLCTFPQ